METQSLETYYRADEQGFIHIGQNAHTLIHIDLLEKELRAQGAGVVERVNPSTLRHTVSRLSYQGG